MAGDSDITAILAARNDFVYLSTGSVPLDDSGLTYLDVSTMDGSKVILLVEKTSTALVPTVVVVDGAKYTAGTIGNLTQLTTAGTPAYVVGPLETARFKDSDGYIKLTKSTADASTIYVRAILLP